MNKYINLNYFNLVFKKKQAVYNNILMFVCIFIFSYETLQACATK